MSKRSIEKIPVIGPLSKLPFGKYILLWFTINIGLAVLCIVLSITPIIPTMLLVEIIFWHTISLLQLIEIAC